MKTVTAVLFASHFNEKVTTVTGILEGPGQPFVPNAEDIQRPFSHRLMRKIGRDVPKNWEQFLGKMYWNAELRED